jgi:hypothetical protein
MLIPQLEKDKDLDLCKYTLICFMERLCFFDRDVVQPSPQMKTSGIEGDIKNLNNVAIKMIERLEKMKGLVKDAG